MKKIFVCSPLRGDYDNNLALAKKLCRRVVEGGDAPFAPHVLYTQFLDDANEEHRAKGILCGEVFLETCEELWVYWPVGRRQSLPSAGMRYEVDLAMRLGIKVVWHPAIWEGL